MSGFSIGGIASGLDTAAIVQQLMALERQPLQVMANKRTAWQKADEAWGSITTKLSSVRAAVDALKDPAALAKAVTATSSNEAVASVKVTGTPSVGPTTLRVDRLAAAHRTAVGGSFAAATDLVGAGTLTVRGTDGTALGEVTFTETTTVADAARQLDALGGVRAQVVNTGADGHRIVLTAEKTGADAAFTVEAPPGHRFETTDLLTQGVDAQLSMGGLTITRPSNIVSDLYDGMELRLTSVGDVEINVERDVDASAKLVKGLVDAVNGALTELNKHGNTSATAGERGVLAGNTLVRSLRTELRGVVASLTTGAGEYTTPNTIGVSLTRDGKLTLDETKLRAAITADPDAVAALVGRASSATHEGVAVTGTGRAATGTYQLHLDVAASVAQVTGAVYTPPTGEPKVFTITTASGKAVQVTLATSETSAASAVSKINAALRAAGDDSVSASVDGDAIKLSATRAGPAGDFTVSGSGDLGLDAVTGGVNAVGRLIDADGVEHTLTGSGRTLTGPTGSSVAGLVLTVPLGATGHTGDVTVADGLAGAFDRVLRATEGTAGSIATARKNVQSRITDVDKSLEASERRLELRERTIRAQFTAMETALATLQSQGSWLAGQIGSLGGGT